MHDLNLQNQFFDFILGKKKKSKVLKVIYLPKYINSTNNMFQNTRSIPNQY